MINWTQCDAVERDIEKVGGAWVFRGARVPFYSEGAKADIEHRYLGSLLRVSENFASDSYSKERKAPNMIIPGTFAF